MSPAEMASHPYALKTLALALGGGGVVGGLWALRFPQQVQGLLRSVPRHVWLGRLLILVDVVWAIWFLNQMELGEWNWLKAPPSYPKRWGYYGVVILGYLYIVLLLDDYIGARGLGIFMILLAKPVLAICFLRDETSRLVLTTLAYVWVVAGLCFFCAPHWLRDWIGWWSATERRWGLGCRAKIAFGCVLLALAIFAY